MLADMLSAPSSKHLSNTSFKALLLLIVGLSIGLRFYRLTHHSFWYDEGLSLMRSDGDTLGQVLETLNRTPYDKYQPTYFIGLFFWRSLFGDTEAAVRAFSVILGLGSIALTALTALRLFGQRHALWSTALMAVSAYHIYYSQEARAYSLVMLLAALQLWLFSPLMVSGRKLSPARFAGFWAVTTFSLLSSLFLFIFTLALCLSHGLTIRRLKPWAKFWAPLLICAVPGMVFYATSSYIYSIPYFLKKTLNGGLLQNLAFVVSGLLAGVTYLAPTEQLRGPDRLKIMLGYWPHLCLLLGVVATLGTVALRQMVGELRSPATQARPTTFLVWLIATSLIFSLLFSAATGMAYLPRHGAFIFLAIALLVPITFCRPAGITYIELGLRRAALGATVVLMMINGIALRNYYVDESYARDDYRAVAAYVNHHSDASDVSVLLWGNAYLLKYYGDNRTVSNWNLSGKDVLSQVSDIAGEADRVLILVNREQTQLQYSVPEVFESAYQLENSVTFPYFVIYQFRTR